jgi:hypothetical protein
MLLTVPLNSTDARTLAEAAPYRCRWRCIRMARYCARLGRQRQARRRGRADFKREGVQGSTSAHRAAKPSMVVISRPSTRAASEREDFTSWLRAAPSGTKERRRTKRIGAIQPNGAAFRQLGFRPDCVRRHRHHRTQSGLRVRRAHPSNRARAKGARPPRHQPRCLYPVDPRAWPRSWVESVDCRFDRRKLSSIGVPAATQEPTAGGMLMDAPNKEFARAGTVPAQNSQTPDFLDI